MRFVTTDPRTGGYADSVGAILGYITGGTVATLVKVGTGDTDWASVSPAMMPTPMHHVKCPSVSTDPRSGAGRAGVVNDVVLYYTGGASSAGTYLIKYGTGDTDWIALPTFASISGVTGSGTSGRGVRWTSSGTIGTGAFVDDGTNVSLAGTLTLSTFTQGSVLFAGASGVVSQDNANLFYDDPNNRFGIGTNAPTKPLHVAGDVCVTGSSSILTVGVTGITMPAFTATTEFSKDGAFNSSINSVYSNTAGHHGEFMVFRGRGTAASPSAIQSGDTIGQFAFTGAQSATAHFSGAYIQSTATENWVVNTNLGARIDFVTTTNAAGSAGRATRLTIDHDGKATFTGNVAITSTTATQLVVGASTNTKTGTSGVAEFTNTAASSKVSLSTYGTGTQSELSFYRARGTAGSSTAVQSGDTLGNIAFAGNGSGGDNSYSSAFIQGIADQTWSSTVGGSRMTFLTTTNGGLSAGRLIRLTIQNDGGITLTNSAAAAVSAANELRLRYNTTGHVLQVSANGGAYATISTGVGTANRITKWSNTTGALTDSIVTDNGTTVSVAGAFSTTGNCTLGDSTADTHTINGRATITGQANQHSLVVNNALTGQTSSINGVRAELTGSFDATAGTRAGVAVAGIASSTRSAGANNLTNYGLYGDALNGQVNYALFTERGDVLLNATSGSTTCMRDFAVNGNVTLGDASGDSHTVNGNTTFVNDITVTGGTTCNTSLRVNGTTQCDGNVRLGDAAADTIGFYTTAGVAQQTVTGSRSGNAALADLLTKLANLGLIVDGTT